MNDEIHDCWFDIEHLRYNKGDESLTVPFFARRAEDTSASRAPTDGEPTQVLVVNAVEELQLVDTEEIGIYDFDRISYDAKSSVLQILTNIPLRLEMRVKRLDLAVRDR